jgi:hypothetical protein
VVEQVVDSLDRGRALVEGRGRPDLAGRLDGTRAKLADRAAVIVVVGEFKRGKSTLVNALLQTAVCPVDADIVTAVPTVIRYGEPAGVTAQLQPTEGAEPESREFPLDAISELVSEAGGRQQPAVTAVEIRLPHRMLRSGLRLIDTPGVGGLDSAHGVLAMSTLDEAQGMLFVKDASQELTAPELDFLRQAVERCSAAALAVTKTDLYPEWRRIVELDGQHLARAGIDVPIIPVSSFLRLRARRLPDLNEESGYPALVEFVAAQVVAPDIVRAAVTAARDVDFVTRQVEQEVVAEAAVLAGGDGVTKVVAGLSQTEQRTARLASSTATWQQTLTDGIQDLVADVEHDLTGRLRAVMTDVETIIEQGDPKDLWSDAEVWLQRHVAEAAVGNRDVLRSRAESLAKEVAMRFDLDAGVEVELAIDLSADVLSGRSVAAMGRVELPGGRLGSLLLAARSTIYVPMLLFGAANAVLLAVPGVGPALALLGAASMSTTLGAGIGQKLIRDEQKRQRAYRQQQAKIAARRFVDEVAFVLNKETRDALRATQRQLRDEFQARAVAMHRSTVAARDVAVRAGELDPAVRARRAEEVTAEASALLSVQRELRQLTRAAEPVGGLRV